MCRHEEVQTQHAFLRCQAFCNGRNGEARAVAGQQCILAGALLELLEKRLLDVQALRDAFDHKIHRAPVEVVQ